MNAQTDTLDLQTRLRYVDLDGTDRRSLELEMEVYNPTGAPIRFLSWHTPMEGYRNHFLHVLNRAGHAVDYRGETPKRGSPRDTEYLTIPAGERLTAQVNLFEGYPVAESGVYSIQFFGDSVNGLRDSNVLFFTLADDGSIETSPLTVDLRLERVIVPVGEPILVEFAVGNAGTEAVAFLPWYTPLETIPTRYLDVTGPNGERVQYLSLMIDRPRPKPTDYIRISPGERRSARVDLQPLFRFGTGTHTLRYLWIAEDFAAIHPLSLYLEASSPGDDTRAAAGVGEGAPR
jgi:hypothetical protein